MIGVHAGAIGAKRHLLEAILEQQEAVHEDVWNVVTPHVVTSQHRDVGLTTMQVNKQQRRDVSKSRHCNVVTSQRRDVATSRRPCECCFLII